MQENFQSIIGEIFELSTRCNRGDVDMLLIAIVSVVITTVYCREPTHMEVLS